MKVLIRGDEVILECNWTPWIRANLAWLTGQETDSKGNPLPGDGWRLENWYEPDDAEIFKEELDYEFPDPKEEETEAPKSFWFDGKEYTEEELCRLLN